MTGADDRYRAPACDAGPEVARPSRGPFLVLGVVVGPVLAWVVGESGEYLEAAGTDPYLLATLGLMAAGLAMLGGGTALAFGGAGPRASTAFSASAWLLLAELPSWFDRPGRLAWPLVMATACAAVGRWLIGRP